MTTDFRDVRAVDSSRLHGDQSERIGRPRRTLLDEADASSESPFPLPSVRAETGALLERQLLISGGLEERWLPPAFADRGSRRIALIFGLLALAGTGAGFALYAHYQNIQGELRAEIADLSETIATVRSDNERLLHEQREAGLRLEKTTDELAREATEKQRLRLETERKEGELKLAREELRSLRSAIDGLKEQSRKLEAERLSELGAFLRESLALPMELFRSISRPAGAAASVGPVPRDDQTAPLVESPPDSAARPVPPREDESRASPPKPDGEG